MAETEKRKFSETIDEDLDAADDEATKRAAKAKILHAYDDEMSFPRAKVGMLIGPKGSNVKEIMRQSGCKIVVDQRGEGGDVMIYFRQDTASKEGILLAKTLIAKLLGEGCTFLRAEDERTNATTKGVSMIKCPHERVGYVQYVRLFVT
jgi:polyribonucleotide nucleotidyltransferase